MPCVCTATTCATSGSRCAEEKAYALPAKLAVPMMVCIFPVLFVVILLPVIVRLHMNGYF